MTAEELKAVQNNIQWLMQIKAANLLDTQKIEPIYDGVCDIELYLKSPTKIMWVLKEAYDDFNESGEPCGGGWYIYEEWNNKAKINSVTSNRSWQPIMYVLKALADGGTWDDLSWIRDEREKYLEVLKACAYVNINKLPAGKTSGDLTEKFKVWEDIINAQIIAYKPDVIIFGNTYGYFSNQCYVKNPQICQGVPGKTGAYKTKIGDHPTLLIDAYHPNQRSLTRQEYVDSILFSVRENLG
ncbi:MAG: hypothetical protein K2M39_09675 [Muribaculaceae bacterium]|nr:hypothetical protein [Muribaculaceae bacterium]